MCIKTLYTAYYMISILWILIYIYTYVWWYGVFDPRSVITFAWAVIILLYSWLSAINCTPGPDNSNLINTEKAVPTRPENKANIRYNPPMSLALEEKLHLSLNKDISELILPLILLISLFVL